MNRQINISLIISRWRRDLNKFKEIWLQQLKEAEKCLNTQHWKYKILNDYKIYKSQVMDVCKKTINLLFRITGRRKLIRMIMKHEKQIKNVTIFEVKHQMKLFKLTKIA